LSLIGDQLLGVGHGVAEKLVGAWEDPVDQHAPVHQAGAVDHSIGITRRQWQVRRLRRLGRGWREGCEIQIGKARVRGVELMRVGERAGDASDIA